MRPGGANVLSGRQQWTPPLRVAYLLAITVFSKELLGIGVGASVIDVFLILLSGYGIISSTPSQLAVRVGIIWCYLITISVALCSQYGYPVDVVIKQGAVAAVVYVGIANLLQRTDAASLTQAYWTVSVAAAIFGCVQFAASRGGLMILMKQAGRLDSLTYEPSHYAIAIAPAAFLATRNLLASRNFKDWQSIIILLSMLLTVSLTAVIILVVCFCLLVVQKQGAVLAACALAVAFYLYTHQELLPETIRDRLDASLALEADAPVSEISNLSVLSPVSNWNVAVATLEQGRYFGNGIGGHVYAYNEHFVGTAFASQDRFGINSMGAHSLIIRAFSELGILGLLGYLAWVAKGFRELRNPYQLWWTLSAIYLVGRMIKLGGFFEIGLPVMLLAPWQFSAMNDSRRLS